MPQLPRVQILSTASRLSLQARPFSTKQLYNMPLVVPGINSQEDGNDKTQEWMNKLVGKKIGETSDQTTFAKTDLPKEHRVIQKGTMVTKDFKPERLNVHLADDGTVSHVTHQ
ncbi:peptidase inhibitor [Phlyctema vagabunda]|uniref:Peptidase inhibitor n=1 Tax=Phlyctema vagabunda TaxID=108571 RepID=A0ABR4PX38_9HELO